MRNRWIDCHCHLSLESVSASDLETILKNCLEHNLSRFVLGGYEPTEWNRQKEIVKEFKGEMFFSAGVHPWLTKTLNLNELNAAVSKIQEQLNSIHFIGELGLDQNAGDISVQKDIFSAQLDFAQKYSKPLMIHAVGMHEEVLQSLQKFPYRGYVHAFSGDWGLAKRYLACGMKLSFDPRSLKKSEDVIKKIPENDFLIESDAPNSLTKSPLAIFDVAERVAVLRNLSRDDVLNQVALNFDSIMGAV